MLHEWRSTTRTFQELLGSGGGSTGVDDDFEACGLENVGAWILGRNMFGPIRGDWSADGWKGWWGDNPRYHTDVFILTHYARGPIEMAGGTTFHFVTEGVQGTCRSVGQGQSIRAAMPGAARRVQGERCRRGGLNKLIWRTYPLPQQTRRKGEGDFTHDTA